MSERSDISAQQLLIEELREDFVSRLKEVQTIIDGPEGSIGEIYIEEELQRIIKILDEKNTVLNILHEQADDGK